VRADKLYLVGFMGAGKTTVASALGRRLGWRSEDVDEDGGYFRQAERAVLSELLPVRNMIVATGGGTFADPGNRATILSDGAVAWLDLPLSRVIERIPPDGRRPLAADLVQMEELYLRRRQAYAEAHVRIDAAKPVDEIVERLLEWIGY